MNLTDFDLNSCDIPEPELESMPGTTSPSSFGGPAWAPSTEEFGPTSPTATWETPWLSPNMTMEQDKPRRIREWRKIIKPEQCPECDMSFPYQTELRKHIAARHKHIAVRHKVPTELYVCTYPRCQKTYPRKDNFLRHLTRRHGRPKMERRSRRRRVEVEDEYGD
ncbi:hypothetical protein C8A00DRAFT_18263 [Chaetomidium leptoderma]|uniref:C2H2-type domain-containing protein n=1 Tax=Chaetomidium leptoderma TaxID=669021 RepID=A0AAN6VFK2_9PEZI|nr:hypothetical protein C8A00DRAFT_18263 [Chaetomidium leptoderma]